MLIQSDTESPINLFDSGKCAQSITFLHHTQYELKTEIISTYNQNQDFSGTLTKANPVLSIFCDCFTNRKYPYINQKCFCYLSPTTDWIWILNFGSWMLYFIQPKKRGAGTENTHADSQKIHIILHKSAMIWCRKWKIFCSWSISFASLCHDVHFNSACWIWPGLSTSETASCSSMSPDWKERAASSTGEWK